MKIGILANTTKDKVFEVVSSFVEKLKANGFEYNLSSSMLPQKDLFTIKIKKSLFLPDKKLCENCDMIISIGGDGTMLASAYAAHEFDKPVLGINFGKLGFLAEVNINQLDIVIEDLKNNDYSIEERLVIKGECPQHNVGSLIALNDLVIDKAGWPKMIDISLFVGGDYVTTFAADGLIAATPTGSTGYSISVGGPIVSPDSNVIILSPISPHSLSMRPLVIPNDKEIRISVNSLGKEVQVNCDGQRVFTFAPPLDVIISKSKKPFRLVHTSLTNYFETLRSKLLWGIDLRNHILKFKDQL